ncbi:MAG TPA: lysylphosphatidylglycerol synthase transmembrane domain-containing protein, partial [Labilithrix sp.]
GAKDEAASGRGRLVLALKGAAMLVFVLLLVRALAHEDWSGAAERLRSVGPAALLVMLPFPLAMLLDATAWGRIMATLGQRVPLSRLFPVRIATESLTTALPAGGLAAEAISPFLVAKGDREVFTAALTSSATKRWLIIRTHGYYVAGAAILTFGILGAHSKSLLRHEGLPWVVLVCSVGLVALSLALQSATTRLGLAARVHDGIARLRSSRFFARFAAHDLPRESFEKVDAELARLGKTMHPLPAALIFATWVLESIETFIILGVLGVDVPFLTVVSFDAALSIVRTVAVFAPSGVGPQDLGYLAFFEAYGLPSALGPAFLLMKRVNQLVWAVAGVALLFFFSRLKPEARSLEPS